MLRRFALLMIALVMMVVAFPASSLVHGQDGAAAWTQNATNIRTGPGRNFPVITTLPADTPLAIEARNADSSWILLRTLDGQTRGWGSAPLFRLADGVSIEQLPVSEETLPAPAAPASGAGAGVSGTAPLNVPQVPRITGAIRSAMRAVYLRGQQLGNNPRVFSKVGDCQTDHWAFMNVFGWGNYSLGQYGNLQGVIDYFRVSPREGVGNSFDARSMASHNGFNSAAVLDPQWANPSFCEPGERPLLCEYRLNRPAVAIIMFGTADVLVMSPEAFYTFMDRIVEYTLEQGIIPVLSTFPENPAAAERSRQMNQLVLRLGQRRSVPVMNLADAVRPLPNWGLAEDGIHLTLPPGDASGFFTAENLQYGYTVRNLLVLQTLDVIWRQIIG